MESSKKLWWEPRKNRRAAAFARWVGTLNAENDPVAQPILNAIHGVLEWFFDDFFSKNPSLDKKLKKRFSINTKSDSRYSLGHLQPQKTLKSHLRHVRYW
jgi:hypothetical protein